MEVCLSCASENGADFSVITCFFFFETVRCLLCSGIRGDIYLIATQVGYICIFTVLFRDQVEIWGNRGCETRCVYFAHLGPFPSL